MPESDIQCVEVGCDKLVPIHIFKANLSFPRARQSDDRRCPNLVPIRHARVLAEELNGEVLGVSIAPNPRHGEANSLLSVLCNGRWHMEVRLPSVEPIPQQLGAGRIELVAVVDVIAGERQAVVQQ